VSVPLYPLQTAEHVREILRRSGAVACFLGKLDDPAIAAGVDADVARIRLPLGPPLPAPPLPLELGLWFGRLGLPIHDGYGMTETGVDGRLRVGMSRTRPVCAHPLDVSTAFYCGARHRDIGCRQRLRS
jgi:hypothetical protein